MLEPQTSSQLWRNHKYFYRQGKTNSKKVFIFVVVKYSTFLYSSTWWDQQALPWSLQKPRLQYKHLMVVFLVIKCTLLHHMHRICLWTLNISFVRIILALHDIEAMSIKFSVVFTSGTTTELVFSSSKSTDSIISAAIYFGIPLLYLDSWYLSCEISILQPRSSLSWLCPQKNQHSALPNSSPVPSKLMSLIVQVTQLECWK